MNTTSSTTGYGGVGAADAILAADFVTCSQWIDMHHPAARTGEQRLMLAILEQAIDDLRKPQNLERGDLPPAEREGWRRRVAADADCWLRSASYGAFSFNWTCDALDLDAGRLRAALLDWDGRLPRRSANYGNVAITGTRERVRG